MMKSAPMTQEEFILLLEEILQEKREKSQIHNPPKYIAPYNNLYDKCLLGYEITHAKKIYAEETFNFKIMKDGKETIEAKGHLCSAVLKLVKLYGKEEVVSALKDI